MILCMCICRRVYDEADNVYKRAETRKMIQKQRTMDKKVIQLRNAEDENDSFVNISTTVD